MLSVKYHCNKCLQQTCQRSEGGDHQHKERGIYLLGHDQLQKNNLLYVVVIKPKIKNVLFNSTCSLLKLMIYKLYYITVV